MTSQTQRLRIDKKWKAGWEEKHGHENSIKDMIAKLPDVLLNNKLEAGNIWLILFETSNRGHVCQVDTLRKDQIEVEGKYFNLVNEVLVAVKGRVFSVPIYQEITI